ncbi:MAG: glutathione S-transferase family protein [Polyangiaceae bacterium]
MRLYHHPMSSNARRAVMTAVHLGLVERGEVELVFVDLSKGAQKKPEFLSMNVSGKVPVLDDDGFFLAESHAIMQYLADRTPGHALYPTELKPRAEVNRWLFWSAHQLAPGAGLLNWERVVKGFLGQGAPDEAIVRKGEQLVSEAARVLDAHLAKREWVAADRLTLADFAIASTLMSLESAKLPFGDSPRALAWFERVKALDAWKKTSP